MKYILIMLFQAGTGVVSVDRMAAISAEFDDLPACQAVIAGISRNATSRITAHCFAKGSTLPPAPSAESK